MYRPRAHAVDDPAILCAAMRARRFATIAAIVHGAVQFAYAPVVIDSEAGALGRVRFHLARSNPLAMENEFPVRLSFMGPDGYVSPDWYASAGLVPTWNYIAVEASGCARRLDSAALRQLLIDLSAEEERRLAPKPPWTLDKVPEERIAALLEAICGFEVTFAALEGRFKLSQERNEADFEGALAGLEKQGDAASLALADAMRRARGA